MSPVKNAAWIEVTEIPEGTQLETLIGELDLGEAEAIVLAETLHADWLLMDESSGRNLAKVHGLQVIGLLGALLLAKEQGHIDSLKLILNDLIAKSKFWVGKELYDRLIILAGE